MAEYLYVCRFSNGHIKVGRSATPNERIQQHEGRVSCVGVELVESLIAQCQDQSERRESELIRCCAAAAGRRYLNEWFADLSFSDACEWASQLARCDLPDLVAPQTPSLDDRKRLAAMAGVKPSVLLQALNGQRPPHPIECVRIEQQTHAELRRWDLRPKDWHEIWPELIDLEGAPAIPEKA